MKCVSCLAGYHASCLGTSCDCNHASKDSLGIDPSPTSEEDTNESEVEANGELDDSDDVRGSVSGRRGGTGNSPRRQLKRDATLKDQQSTGRKRAARMYPLNREGFCEWRYKSNCGGGLSPILGCVSGLQQARHHGPDKSVSNNEEGNVHRICHFCHNRWHAANNADYDWNETRVSAHAPRPMTDAEKFEAMLNEGKSKSKHINPIKD